MYANSVLPNFFCLFFLFFSLYPRTYSVRTAAIHSSFERERERGELLVMKVCSNDRLYRRKSSVGPDYITHSANASCAGNSLSLSLTLSLALPFFPSLCLSLSLSPPLSFSPCFYLSFSHSFTQNCMSLGVKDTLKSNIHIIIFNL